MFQANGFTLIEILISLILLSLALISLDAMELMSLRESRAVYFSHVADNQIQNLIEQFKIFKVNETILADWNKENSLILPQGKGTISGNYPQYLIKLCYQSGKMRCIVKKSLLPAPP